jgi:hypothetical protein
VNDLTYDYASWYCTTHDSRLIIKDYAEFEFQLNNPNITPEDLYSVLRIYNETRSMEYDLTGIVLNEATIKLSKNTINTSIGLAKADIVVIDYKIQSETLEYYPVVVNYLNIVEGVETVYIEGTDISSVIIPGTVLNLIQPDSDVQYSFMIDSASYDGYGTRINLASSIPEDITNPKIFITDTEIEYKTVPVKADPIIAGSVKINFPGTNISNIFRPGTLIKINDDLYPVSNAAYENSVSSNISTLASKIIPGIKKTIITLNSAVINTCKDSTELSSIGYSDCPVYNEGDTEIIPEKPAVTIMQQPGLIISNTNNTSYDVSVTSTQFIIDNTAFSYATYGILGDLTTALLAALPSLSVVSYVPQWYSNRLVPTSLSVYKDSETVFSMYDRLEYHGSDSTVFVDTTNFTLTESGSVLLTNPLVGYDRYNLDYMGRQFLGESQVEYSMQYFVNLPAKSKVSASFQYDNLDQFYI